MLEIRLTPAGHLALDTDATPSESMAQGQVRTAFEGGWRAGLFMLAAEKVSVKDALTPTYWRRIAEHYCTGLCHPTP